MNWRNMTHEELLKEYFLGYAIDGAIQEKDGKFFKRIEVPGFNSVDLDIEFQENGILRVNGSKEDKLFGKTKISKSFYVNPGFEIENASIKDGILLITFKKKTTNSLKIPISSE